MYKNNLNNRVTNLHTVHTECQFKGNFKTCYKIMSKNVCM